MLDILQEEEWLEAVIIQNDIEEGEYTEEEAKERFKIKSLEAASWAFRKIKALNQDIEATKALAKAEYDRIKEWEIKATKDTENSIKFFEFLLTEYYLDNKEIYPKFKVSTPYGKVSSRKQQPEWLYDNEKAIKWLLEHDENLVRVKYEPDKANIKKAFKIVGDNVVSEDGEIVEGITILERPEAVVIKVEV